MTYASIMVAVDLGDQARPRTGLGADLADTFHARLIGLAAQMPDYGGCPVGPTPGGTYGIPAIRDAVLNDLSRARTAFEDAARGRSRIEWRSSLDFPLAFLTSQAAAADLVVLGRGDDGDPCMAVDPGDAVMRLGRPVLIVPPRVDHLEARRVAIGWKNTREARRAVQDALPLLNRASQAVIVSIDDGRGAADTRDVVGFLQAHDVDATSVARDALGAAASEALIDVAAEYGADLIVTGAYGHGRLREWAFGGVTRDLLAGAPVCCLMSH